MSTTSNHKATYRIYVYIYVILFRKKFKHALIFQKPVLPHHINKHEYMFLYTHTAEGKRDDGEWAERSEKREP